MYRITTIAFILLLVTSLHTPLSAQIGPVVLSPDGKPAPAPLPQETPLTLQQAIQLLQRNSVPIQLASKTVDIARAEKQKLNAAWYPALTATGMYAHFSNDIKAEASMGEVLKPIQNTIAEHLPSQEQVNGILKDAIPVLEQLFPHLSPQQITQVVSGIGEVVSSLSTSLSNMLGELNGLTLSFPILQQNIASLDANLTWPLFTGGKRIYANRIGKSLIANAEEMKQLTLQAQLAILTETYYTLKLSKEVVTEKQESVATMTLLFNNAMSLLRNGLINKAEMLVAQVAMEEAIRELENARDQASVAEKALRTLLGISQTEPSDPLTSSAPMISTGSTQPLSTPSYPGMLNPVTDFFILYTLPPAAYYKEQIIAHNPQLKILDEQQVISKNEKKIAQSSYLPNIALFAKQTLYTYQIPKNLAPRTVFGAGLAWNLFDGLTREKNIRISQHHSEQITLQKEQAQKDLFLLTDKLHAQMMDALYNLRALESTVELCKELLKMREKGFQEGMASSLDVVSARTSLTKARLAQKIAYWQFDIAYANLCALCGESIGSATTTDLPPQP